MINAKYQTGEQNSRLFRQIHGLEKLFESIFSRNVNPAIGVVSRRLDRLITLFNEADDSETKREFITEIKRKKYEEELAHYLVHRLSNLRSAQGVNIIKPFLHNPFIK